MIPLIKSTFYNEKQTKKSLASFIQSAKFLSFGHECQLFETEFAHWQEREQCVLLNSGSSANLAIIQALLNSGKLKARDPVGFSAITWSTNVMPLIQLNLRPIPVDVSLETLNITPKILTDVLKKTKLRMLFITNLLGFCDDLEEIAAICKRRGIILIEDNCESLGSVYHQKKLGNFGLASTFSFYVGHHMSTIEGGAVATDDEELATMIRIVRAHGWDRNLAYQKQDELRKLHNVNSTFYSRYTFYDLGYNLRPTEITGFLGRKQLKFLPAIIKKRERNFKYLAKTLYANPEIYPVRFSHMDTISNFAVPMICREKTLRDDLVKRCDGKIEIRPVVGGNMLKQPFFEKYIHKKFRCPNAELIHQQGLYFGNNPELTSKDLKLITKVFTV